MPGTKVFEGQIAPVLSNQRRKELSLFEKRIGIRFRRVDLLNLAFCHRSFANEQANPVGNNEKLEFLGDSILGFLVSEYLYLRLLNKSEGDLAKIKSFVVSETSLAQISKDLEIDKFLLLGRGEDVSGGRDKKALLADAFEAVLGAIYLEVGMKVTKKFVLRFLVPEIQKVLENKHIKDYKTLLQEFVQKEYKSYPRYQLVKKTGPDHAKIFWIEVVVDSTTFGPGQGRNKKEAEQKAAQLAWEALGPREENS
ncbi:MAG: ribonuclease III [Spirochaetales bacterium]|nr:ribonuclease III [Spirochaetales bacterium]